MRPSTRKRISRSPRPDLWQLLLAFSAAVTACSSGGLRAGFGGAATVGGRSVSVAGGAPGIATGGAGGSLTSASLSGAGGALAASGGLTSHAGGAGENDTTTAIGSGGWLLGGMSGGIGGSAIATGGVTSNGGSGGSQDGAGDGDGGPSAPTDSSCPTGVLWDAISKGAAVIGYCVPIGDAGLPLGGKVVIDGNGRVVDNTRLTGAAKRQWLDGLASQSFPCLAGQTIPYSCVSE